MVTLRHYYGKAKIDEAFKEHLSTVLNWTVDQYYTDMFNAVGELFEADQAAVLEIVKSSDRVGTATIEKVEAYITEQSIPRWADDTFPWLWSVFQEVNEVWYNFFGIVNEKQIGGYEENLLSRGVLKFAEAVGETSRKQLRDLLGVAMKEGWDQEKTADELYNLFWAWSRAGDLTDVGAMEWVDERLPRYRREMIARTELIRASNNAALMRFQSQGIRYKEWYVTEDDRLCSFCAKMNGKKISLIEPFARVGESVPGGDGEDAPSFRVGYMDVMGPPLHPHCRCTLLPWHPDWEDTPAVDVPDPQDLQPATAVEVEALEEPDIFPDGLPSRVQHVEDLGGSTGATLVEDPETGRKYVRKYGNNADHIRSEALANQLYRALGVRVPPLRLYEGGPGDRPVMLSKYIEDTRTLKEVLREGGPEAQEALAELREGFTADALLGNWDVLGLDYDNILVDPSGKVWRIDNGGSLQYRAQGEKKPVFDKHPLELWSLRNPQVNQQTAKIFDPVDFEQIVRQIEGLNTPAVNAVLSEAKGPVTDVIRGRLHELERMQDYARKMQRDEFSWGYLGEFFRSDQVIRRNLVAQFPDRLEQTPQLESYILEDSQGRRFDRLRGQDSIMQKFYDLVDKNGGDKNMITAWAGQQATSSWSDEALAMKYWIADTVRNASLDEYYWQRVGVEQAREAYQRITSSDYSDAGEEGYTRTMSMLHALNVEFLQNVDLPGNQRQDGIVRLARTVDSGFVSYYDLKKGGWGDITAAPYSSTSITNLVNIGGNEVLMYEVPHWRIMGNYMFERGEFRDTFFYGDRENEIIAILHGLETYYHGQAVEGTPIPSLDWW